MKELFSAVVDMILEIFAVVVREMRKVLKEKV